MVTENTHEKPEKSFGPEQRSVFDNVRFQKIEEGGETIKMGDKITLPKDQIPEGVTGTSFPISKFVQRNGEMVIDVKVGNEIRSFPASMFGFTENVRGRGIFNADRTAFKRRSASSAPKILEETHIEEPAPVVEPEPAVLNPMEESVSSEDGNDSTEQEISLSAKNSGGESWETLSDIEKAVAVDAEIKEIEAALEAMSDTDRPHFKQLLKEKKVELKQYRKGKKSDEKGYVYDPKKDPDAIEPLSEELEAYLYEKPWTNGAEEKLTKEIFLNPEEIELVKFEKRNLELQAKIDAVTIEIETYRTQKIEILAKEKREEEENLTIAAQERTEEKSSKKSLLTDATLTAGAAAILTAGALLTHDGVKHSKRASSPEKEIVAPAKKIAENKKNEYDLKEFIDKPFLEAAISKLDTALYTKLPYDGRYAYLIRTLNQQEQKEHPGAYVIVDKEKRRAYLIGENGKTIGEAGIIRGMAKGDDYNLVDDDFTNKATEGRTPAGWFVLSQDEQDKADRSWHVIMDGPDQKIYIHPLLSKNVKEQKKALESGNLDDGALSAGCLRVEEKFLDLLKENLKEGARCIILTEDKKDGKAIRIDPVTKRIHTIDEKDVLTRYDAKIKDYLTK